MKKWRFQKVKLHHFVQLWWWWWNWGLKFTTTNLPLKGFSRLSFWLILLTRTHSYQINRVGIPFRRQRILSQKQWILPPYYGSYTHYHLAPHCARFHQTQSWEPVFSTPPNMSDIENLDQKKVSFRCMGTYSSPLTKIHHFKEGVVKRLILAKGEGGENLCRYWEANIPLREHIILLFHR